MKILIVGAGFSGSVLARNLAEAGHDIDLIDSRNHVGGNAHDEIIHGINVHTFGPHIFHTNNKSVVDFLSQFTDWIPYQHKVKAVLEDGTYVTLPPNLETKEILDSKGLSIVDTLFRPYTKKMWGKDLEELDPSIINRVPIRNDMNELYFPNDEYQMMPSLGYTNLFLNMLDHENISVKLNTPFEYEMEENYDKIFNSMPIDEYYKFKFGQLPYRSIKFHHKIDVKSSNFPTPTVNFTDSGIYTRVTDWKKYPGGEVKHGELSIITYEEPCDYVDNNYQRFYPVKDVDGKNRELYNQYRSIKNDKVTFIGRCGQYVYIDMHQAVNSALIMSKKFLGGISNLHE